MKAGKFDLAKAQFAFEEVMFIIGQPIDVKAKYETDQPEDLFISIDPDESDDMTGERLAHYANQASDVSKNWLIDEQHKRLFELSFKKGIVEWQ